MYIRIIDANFFFALQNYFQQLGVIFIDLNTGQPIYGQVNVDTLGMVTSLPKKVQPKPNNSGDGFLLPQMEPKKISVDVEATLNLYQPPENSENIVTIQVVNQADLDKWYKLTAEVGKHFVELDEFENTFTDTTFHIVPLAVPDPADSTNSAISTMLGNIQNYRSGSDSVYAFSDQDIPLSDLDFDGEE